MAPITKHQYIIGLTYCFWGLIWTIPLIINFNSSDVLIVIPLISLFMLTGMGVIKNKTFSWTLVLVLGFLTFLHFVILIVNEIFTAKDIRGFKSPEIILFFVWSILILFTLYSATRILRDDIKQKLKVKKGQIKLTIATCFVTGALWTLFLLNGLHWA
jgi:hypothetical protein